MILKKWLEYFIYNLKNPEKARKIMKELEEKNIEFFNMLQKIELA
jgi:hypothetical protein